MVSFLQEESSFQLEIILPLMHRGSLRRAPRALVTPDEGGEPAMVAVSFLGEGEVLTG